MVANHTRHSLYPLHYLRRDRPDSVGKAGPRYNQTQAPALPDTVMAFAQIRMQQTEGVCMDCDFPRIPVPYTANNSPPKLLLRCHPRIVKGASRQGLSAYARTKTCLIEYLLVAITDRWQSKHIRTSGTMRNKEFANVARNAYPCTGLHFPPTLLYVLIFVKTITRIL